MKLIAVGVVAVVIGTASANLFGLVSTAVAESTTNVEDIPTYPVVYRVDDLPVWNADAAFDPSILIAYLENTIGADAASAVTIRPYSETAGIVISASSENHRRLANSLQRLKDARIVPQEN